jgi:predicted ATPase
VAFVPLAPLQDAALIPSAIAAALDVREVPGLPLLDSLVAFLRPRRLLVLDNCEHLVTGIAVVGALLQRCPALTVLATSRAPLRLSGERQYPVPPLAVPAEATAALPPLAEHAAVVLFCERVQAVRPDFQLSAENAAVVAQICRRLDGLPLALELAAARAKLLPPQALRTRLERRLPVLTGGPRDAPARQQTLRDTIAWSYDLLSPPEQALFQRLAVFAGGCTLAGAEAVCGAGAGDGVTLLDGLAALVDQSLLVQTATADGEPRFSMLETIREFALEQLEATGDGERARERHAAYCLGLAHEAHFDIFVPAMQDAGVARLAAEQDNLRSALAWCLAGTGDRTTGVELAASLVGFWIEQQHFDEGHGWLQQALAVAAVPRFARARLLSGASYLAFSRTDYKAHLRLAEESLTLWRELDQPRGIADALARLGGALTLLGRPEAGRAAAEESIALWRRLGGGIGLGGALTIFGYAARGQGDVAALQAAAEEELAIAQALPHQPLAIEATIDLARSAFEQDDIVRARRLFEECLTLQRQRADHRLTGVTLLDLTQVALVEVDAVRARACSEEALAIFQSLGQRQPVATALEGLGHASRVANDGRAAARWYAKSLTCLRADRRRGACLYPLAGLAWTALWLGRPTQAARLLAAARALPARRVGIVDRHTYARYQTDIATVRGALGDAAFEAAWAEGEALSLEQASAEALALADEIAALPPETATAAVQ